MNSRASPVRFIYPVSEWPDIPAAKLSDDQIEVFNRRKYAIIGLESGKTYKRLSDEFKIAGKELNRYITRCQLLHDDGRIWGFRALVSGTRIGEFKRGADTDHSKLRVGRGAHWLFRKLLDDHPELDKFLDRLVVEHRRSTRGGRRIKRKDLHYDFVVQCRIVLVDETKYPLCLKTYGAQGFANALKQKLAMYAEKDDAFLSSSSRSTPNRSRPYSNVEIDAHKLDAQLHITIRLPTGGLISRLINRLWVLVAKDRSSRAVLSGLLVISKEINHFDLLRCIRRISEPWSPRELVIPHMRYAPGSGFPSGLIPHCAGRMVDTIHLDNAMAHIALNVRYAVKNSTGSTLNWGDAAEPNERPFVEAFFKSLTEKAIQPLPTGFTPKSVSLPQAIENASFFSPTIREMEDYLDVVLASFNVCGHSGLYGETPLERLARENPTELIRSDVSLNAGWRRLTVVRGKFPIVVDGLHRAHINFKNAEYRSESLPSMVRRGIKSFEGEYDLEDLRKIEAFPIKGWQPDSFNVTKEWATFKHDISLRKLICAEVRAGRFRFDPQRDAMKAFEEHLLTRGLENKQAATALAKLQSAASDTSQPSAQPVKIRNSPERRAPTMSKLGALFPIDLSKKGLK